MCLLLSFWEVLKIAMTIQQIIIIVVSVEVLIIGVAVAFVVWLKSLKKVSAAQDKLLNASTEAEKATAEAELYKAEAESAAAKNDLFNKLFTIVPNVDSMFAPATEVLTKEAKAAKPYQGMKKAVAEAQLKTYADTQGYTQIYNPEEGSKMIEQVVALMNAERDMKQTNTSTANTDNAATTTAVK